eukprot:CAMPEP_0114490574 /NCGR_PEP_ID=MMETSP0109-20121206/2517_1 /TAXON_ID=29199 /ORGANISM="Chlorarachnion reptans, Strain CCCM449" /LENGTH=64 /DNA_ID=CAMNT_0001667205 /DNA_START=324 /DNA_END=518 /DNA_ORIENTATION=-
MASFGVGWGGLVQVLALGLALESAYGIFAAAASSGSSYLANISHALHVSFECPSDFSAQWVGGH